MPYINNMLNQLTYSSHHDKGQIRQKGTTLPKTLRISKKTIRSSIDIKKKKKKKGCRMGMHHLIHPIHFSPISFSPTQGKGKTNPYHHKSFLNLVCKMAPLLLPTIKPTASQAKLHDQINGFIKSLKLCPNFVYLQQRHFAS